MANNTRIYVVTEATPGGDDASKLTSRLVDAGSAAQAIGHCVRPKFAARVAEQSDLVTLLGKGVKVEKAGAE